MLTFYFRGGGHNNFVIAGIGNLEYASVSLDISDCHPSACNKFNTVEGIFMNFYTWDSWRIRDQLDVTIY